jgi:hypothetical protein
MEKTIQEEIKRTQLFNSMITDTKDMLEEFIKISNGALEKKHIFNCFVNRLRRELKISEEDGEK